MVPPVLPPALRKGAEGARAERGPAGSDHQDVVATLGQPLPGLADLVQVVQFVRQGQEGARPRGPLAR